MLVTPELVSMAQLVPHAQGKVRGSLCCCDFTLLSPAVESSVESSRVAADTPYDLFNKHNVGSLMLCSLQKMSVTMIHTVGTNVNTTIKLVLRLDDETAGT